ncbi:hypothetical protein AK830_g8877 [Neonectria ditissima]|uniref:Uncharacterized protein n=1 Tax=Neonectria ditissima TaxID=78410 RepID=A0A0P7B6Y3_9HYPO|nr:hypothetical protein AK830_g8877 [Neonectria ditissima]
MPPIPKFPSSTEFQIELQVLLAANKSFIDFESSRMDFLPFTGQHIPFPPASFDYVPPELGHRQNDPTTEDRYKGWALSVLAYALGYRGLTTNWAMPDNAPLPECFDQFFDSPVWMLPRDPFELDLDRIWKISYDQDIKEEENPDFSFVGVKIISPVYTQDATAGDLPLKGLTEVISSLTESLLTISNDGTRLGVSVRQKGEPLSFEAVKSIASLLWVTDPLLNEVHPPHCGPGSLRSLGLQFSNLAEYHDHIDVEIQLASASTVDDPWNNRISPDRPPLSLLPHPGELSDPRFSHGVGRIQRGKGLPELVHLLGLVPITHTKRDPRPRPAYDFRALVGHSASGMIKFNQHCGTLNFEAISHWASICTHLVSCGIEKSPERILEKLTTLRRQIQDRTVTLFNGLTSRGLEGTAEYYGNNTRTTRILEMGGWLKLKPGVPGPESEPNALPVDRDRSKGMAFLEDLGKKLHTWDSSAKTTENDCYTIGIELEMLTPSSGETEEERIDKIERMKRLNKSHFPGKELEDDFKILRTGATTKPWEDPDPTDSRSYVRGAFSQTRYPQVAEIMKRKLGLFSICDFTMRDLSNQVRTTALNQYFARTGGVYPDPDYDPEWQAWNIRADGSLRTLLNWNGYKSVDGMEIVSPILRDKPEGWETILDVLVGLRRELRLVVDRDCGVHINVGKGTEPISFRHLQRLACLMYCADPVIFSLCDPDRRSFKGFAGPLRNGDGLGGIYKEAWETLPVMPDFAQHMPVGHLSTKDCAVLKKIWMAPDYESLSNLIGPQRRRTCVSIKRITLLDMGSFSGAVEFRHLEGSLDPDLVLRFGQLMATLFRFADKAEPEAWQRMVRNLMLCRNAGSYDLDILRVFLEQLGLGDDVSYWDSRVRNNWELDNWGPSSAPRPIDASSLQVLPPVSPQYVESHLRKICRRQIKPDLNGQGLGDEKIKAPRTIHVREAIQARAESLLHIVSSSDLILQDNLEHTLSDAIEAKESRPNYGEERPVRPEAEEVCPQEGLSWERYGLSEIFFDCQEKARSLSVQKLSREELNLFADLDHQHKDGQDFLDTFSRTVGPGVEVVTDEDWERFLDDEAFRPEYFTL